MPPVKVSIEVVLLTTPPAQVVLGAGAAEITTPLGIVSTSGAERVAATVLAFDNVITSVDVPPALIVAGVKALPTVGVTPAGTLTVNVAMAAPALFPFEVCKAPAASELT